MLPAHHFPQSQGRDPTEWEQLGTGRVKANKTWSRFSKRCQRQQRKIGRAGEICRQDRASWLARLPGLCRSVFRNSSSMTKAEGPPARRLRPAEHGPCRGPRARLLGPSPKRPQLCSQSPAPRASRPKMALGRRAGMTRELLSSFGPCHRHSSPGQVTDFSSLSLPPPGRSFLPIPAPCQA